MTWVTRENWIFWQCQGHALNSNPSLVYFETSSSWLFPISGLEVVIRSDSGVVLVAQISTRIDGMALWCNVDRIGKRSYWKMIVMWLPVRFDNFLRWAWWLSRGVPCIDKQPREPRNRILKMIERMPRTNQINLTD